MSKGCSLSQGKSQSMVAEKADISETIVKVDSQMMIHIMTSVHNSSDLEPQCHMMFEYNSSSLSRQCQMVFAENNTSGPVPQCHMTFEQNGSSLAPQCQQKFIKQ
ncbi:hypothetical protein Tco_0333755, partial [Tanacetum coccineum]